jgi:hypothetical protein
VFQPGVTRALPIPTRPFARIHAMSRLPLLLTLVAALALGAAAPVGAQTVPRSFFGVMVNGPLAAPGAQLEAEAAVMHADGVGSWRVPFEWDRIQPYADEAAVPADERAQYPLVDGVPSDFSVPDAQVAAAARQGIDVLALVLRTPPWAGSDPGNALSSPKRIADYTRYLTTLIGRYGPRGTFWAEHPDVPKRAVRAWQVWNEPNLPQYWQPQPFARPYVRLLKASDKAIHAADPGAKTVMAGLANFSWRDLKKVYAAGARGHFDVAAVHPFSGRPSNSLKITRLNRQVMDAAGDRSTPIWLTELTWSSAKGKTKNTHGWETTDQGQAARLKQAYGLYLAHAKALRLQRIFWYTWASADRDSPNSFEWSGLRRYTPDGTFVDKPAMKAFRSIALKYGRRR